MSITVEDELKSDGDATKSAGGNEDLLDLGEGKPVKSVQAAVVSLLFQSTILFRMLFRMKMIIVFVF